MMTSGCERLRVQDHLLGAERVARGCDVRFLDVPRQTVRALRCSAISIAATIGGGDLQGGPPRAGGRGASFIPRL